MYKKNHLTGQNHRLPVQNSPPTRRKDSRYDFTKKQPSQSLPIRRFIRYKYATFLRIIITFSDKFILTFAIFTKLEQNNHKTAAL
jgi:hypothetical protein